MDFKKLADQAKNEFGKRGGADALRGVQEKAKIAYDERGGAQGLKASAKSVVDAAKTEGSTSDKAKAAAAAAKQAVKTPPPAGETYVDHIDGHVVEGKKVN